MSDGSPLEQKFDLEPNLWHLHYRIAGRQTTWGIEYLQGYVDYDSMLIGQTILQARPDRDCTIVDFLAPGLMPRRLMRPGSWFLHLDYYEHVILEESPSLQILIPHTSKESARYTYASRSNGIIVNGGRIVYAGITPPSGESVALSPRNHP